MNEKEVKGGKETKKKQRGRVRRKGGEARSKKVKVTLCHYFKKLLLMKTTRTYLKQIYIGTPKMAI